MSAYHWTTKENAQKILEDGLHKWSFACKEIDDWGGEVCFEIKGFMDDEDWRGRESPTDWQVVTHECIPPSRLRVVNG